MDNRKNNGNKGHSTKSKGFDKRKNPYKTSILDAISDEDLKQLLISMYKKAIEDEDVPAAKIILEYCLGKPKQQIEQTTTLKTHDFDVSKIYDKKT